MANPYFLNISISFFFFFLILGLASVLLLPVHHRDITPHFLSVKHRKTLLKLMNPRIHKPHLHQSTPLTTSKSSLPNFSNQGLLSLNNKALRACIIIDTSVSLLSVRVFAKFKASLESSNEIEG